MPASRLRPCLPAGVCAFAVAVFLVKVTTGSARICLPRPVRTLGLLSPTVSSSLPTAAFPPCHHPVLLHCPHIPPHGLPRILTTILAFAPARAPRVSHPPFDQRSIHPPTMMPLSVPSRPRVLSTRSPRVLCRVYNSALPGGEDSVRICIAIMCPLRHAFCPMLLFDA